MRMTRHEIVFVATILGALLIGATVKFFRDSHRQRMEELSAPASSATQPATREEP